MKKSSTSLALSNRGLGLRHFIAPVILVLLMITFFRSYEWFEIVGQNLLVGGDFESGIAQGPWRQMGKVGWEREGGFDGSGGVKITAVNGKAGILDYCLGDPSDYKYLLCRGHMRSENVIIGEHPWSSARLLLYFRDSAGNPLWCEAHDPLRK